MVEGQCGSNMDGSAWMGKEGGKKGREKVEA